MKFIDVKSTQVIACPNDKQIYVRYLTEIRNLKPLSREEEIETFKLVEDGDQRAIDKICKHNLLFVVSVAKRYAIVLNQSTLTLEDLIGEGNFGLIVAINRFNYREGNKFISYAVWWIKQAILASIQKNIKTIRIPSNVRNEITKMKIVEKNLQQQLGRSVSTIEVFESMLVDGEELDFDKISKVNNMLMMSEIEFSIDSTISNDSGESTEINQKIKCLNELADDQMITKERIEILSKMLDKLPSRSRNFIKYYFGIGVEELTFKEIGEKYELTTERVRQVINKTLRTLKISNKRTGKYLFPTPNRMLKHEFKDYDKNTLYLI